MNLEEKITRRLRAIKDPLAPLPTTRALGGEFDVSHVTVARLLRRMVDQGLLWQAESGRYYRREAESTLALVRPVSCLVRSLSGWSAWYEQIMRGVSRSCEEQGRGMLLHPVPGLLRQKRPDEFATYAPPKEQRQVFELFLRQRGDTGGFVLLDDVWSDEVLCEYAGRLHSPRMVLRPSPSELITAYYPDFAQGAMLGLSHLLGRGFKHLIFVQPFPDYLPPRHLQKAFETGFAAVGKIDADFEVFESDGSRRFPSLVERLLKSKRERVALICPEDNFSVALLRAITAAGFSLPDEIGFLGGMGSPFLVEAGVTRLTIDFAELGRVAVEAPSIPTSGASQQFRLEPGKTT